MKFWRKKGNIILADRKENTRSKFKGAIVYDTVSGRHGMGFTIDLGSLYPSTMGVLGCSPETLLMQCIGGMDDYVAIIERRSDNIELEINDATKEKIEITAIELSDLIRESGYTISANGTIFSGKMGLLAEFACEGLKLRKMYQGKMRECEEAKDLDGYKVFNLRQKVTKTRNNSIYGVTGEPSFRLYDSRISQSITLSAQFISKHQAVYGDKLLDIVI
jgi:DNA polymerase elongation subunit (family B)